MKRFDIDFLTGLFVIFGIFCLGYLSVHLGKKEVLGGSGYNVIAFFSNISGLRVGSLVEIAGVEVGRVKKIELDKNYQAKLTIRLNKGIIIQEDAIASVKTKGLIGDKFIQITPGGSEKIITKDGKIRETQDTFDIEQAISQLMFGKI
ncbi:MAG: outer membrane lipid asymmetry maintenance protein MlaD [Thermodesulfobacteriota bacterium]|nr:outer membrane lipid asymmetry maintenance protein MlaD [Thermodesulfobacteriota bacterium]